MCVLGHALKLLTRLLTPILHHRLATVDSDRTSLPLLDRMSRELMSFHRRFNFGPTQFQNLLYYAGHNLDSTDPCDGSVPCVLPFAGLEQRNTNSIVLVTNGISFAIQVSYSAV